MRRQKIMEPSHRPKVVKTENSMEFGKPCEVLSWNHRTSTLHRSETNGIAERAVRRVKGRYFNSIATVRTGWKVVVWRYGMLLLFTKWPRLLDRWEHPFWTTIWRNIPRAHNTVWSNARITSDFSKRPSKNSAVWLSPSRGRGEVGKEMFW